MIVAGDLVPHGGMDRANLELARFLAADRPVHVVAHWVDPTLAAMPNVTVHRVPRPFGRHLLGQPFLARVGRRWASRLSAAGFRVVVNGGNCAWPDVNWVHCVHAAYPAPVAGGVLGRTKIRTTHQLHRWSEGRAIQAARVVVCNSRRTGRDVVELLGVCPDRVRVVYLAGDPDQLRPVTADERGMARKQLGWDERPWVGFVGQLGNRLKGFDTLYSAWRELCRESGWDANLAVVGEGPTRPVWEARAAADGLSSRIRLLGFRRDVPEVLAACDALVAPSRYDAYGLAVHEALCRGLPAIVSAAAGVSERYPADLADLILTDPDDPGELADRLRHWRANLDAFSVRIRSLADDLRSRTWTDMARDIAAAVEDRPKSRTEVS